MRTRSHMLLVGVGALILAVAMIGTTSSVASSPFFEIDSPNTEFIPGHPATIEVTLAPEMLGGYGHLYATADGVTEYVCTVEFVEPTFPIDVEVPTTFAGTEGDLTFTLNGFTPDGLGAGGERIKRPVAPIDFE